MQSEFLTVTGMAYLLFTHVQEYTYMHACTHLCLYTCEYFHLSLNLSHLFWKVIWELAVINM